MAGSTDELWFVNWEFGGTPYAKRTLYEKWSPLAFVRNWKTPMLIVHSQLDYRVDPSEGYQAFTAAKVLGVPAKFLYFPDEGHWVTRPRNRRLWCGVRCSTGWTSISNPGPRPKPADGRAVR
jgi:dipeptidyl aminopeptidase/acylaminoacyl peptidase